VVTEFDHISINKFLDHLRREPNPDDVLDWVDARLRLGLAEGPDDITDLADAVMDARGMIEAYRDAQIALA
jgi:hypothetical protein